MEIKCNPCYLSMFRESLWMEKSSLVAVSLTINVKKPRTVDTVVVFSDCHDMLASQYPSSRENILL